MPALAQSASLIGLYGLDLAAIAILAAPATLIDAPGEGARRPYLIVAVALLALMTLGGAWRLWTNPTSFVPTRPCV